MSERLGVLIAGVKGGVATTTIAGAFLARRGLAEPRGLLTETEPFRSLGLCGLDRMEFGGWDIAPGTLEDAARRHGIVGRELLDAIAADLRAVEVFEAPVANVSDAARRAAKASSAPSGTGLRSAAERLVREIDAFRAMATCERVVVANVTSTGPEPQEPGAAWPSLEAFERALDADDARVTPAMLYAYAAFRAGASFVNFTPNACAEIPPLQELARHNGTCFAGKDGKTGQTLYKTVLANLFRVRNLRVVGWYSANILGNQDGAVLCADAAHTSPKIQSKRQALEDILGYSDFEHVVRIDYYGPRGDHKEAWDVIDFEGWLGHRMSMKINWLGEDSILAAPVLLDAVRLTAHEHARGATGPLPHLGVFFKHPYGTRVSELGDQYRMLLERVQGAQQAPRAVPVDAKRETPPAGPPA